MVLIDAFPVRLELMPNFHNENSENFHHIFVVKIRQQFALGAS